ncbi:hypothetical protein PR048_003483 [Dryococelus australis]|uniref:Uncharacterized protein n=1 Tax=Dryococelus australis TaxID=614101 RepID=A0ABQ9IN74_9NEOP|nr:hypothetical protein PR048_003483 [Dryococelus australis]
MPFSLDVLAGVQFGVGGTEIACAQPAEIGLPRLQSVYLESFAKDAEVAMSELEKLRQRLTSFKSGVRVSSIEETLSFNTSMFQGVSDLTHKVLQAGAELLQQHGDSGGARRPGREPAAPQDALDGRDRVERLLEIVRGRLQLAEEARLAMERAMESARELSSLEDGVTRVTNWILGPAETMLNGQSEVGFDVVSAEELRQEHEALELQCRVTLRSTEHFGKPCFAVAERLDCLPSTGFNPGRSRVGIVPHDGEFPRGSPVSVNGAVPSPPGLTLIGSQDLDVWSGGQVSQRNLPPSPMQETYGHYAELLHKIDTLPEVNIPLPEDLKSQRDFMDFVCRSFATRLERRRNVLITSLRFYRLVAEVSTALLGETLSFVVAVLRDDERGVRVAGEVQSRGDTLFCCCSTSRRRYFEMTSEVFESLVKSNHVETFESASTTLRKLQESQISIVYDLSIIANCTLWSLSRRSSSPDSPMSPHALGGNDHSRLQRHAVGFMGWHELAQKFPRTSSGNDGGSDEQKICAMGPKSLTVPGSRIDVSPVSDNQAVIAALTSPSPASDDVILGRMVGPPEEGGGAQRRSGRA